MTSSLLLLIAVFTLLRDGKALSPPRPPDFIVVGGGTAGCVVAARLCAGLNTATVVLLERGPVRSPESEFRTRAPRNFVDLTSDPTLTEVFNAEPDLSLQERRTTIVTGNTLGGSSSINGMQYSTPQANDVDTWGIQGLSATVAQFFYRRVYRKVGFARQSKAFLEPYGYADEFLNAASVTGFKNEFRPFSNKPRNAAWGTPVSVSKSGRRLDSCTAYLKPVRDGKCKHNLRVIQDATVTKVLLSTEKVPRAIGIEYVRSTDKRLQNKEILFAGNEVILSAGPYGSPKLLQLSGIGPRSHLQNIGVETKVDLPVGQKTQGRPVIPVVSFYSGAPLDPSNNSTVIQSTDTLRKWRKGRPSALGVTGFPTLLSISNVGYVTSGTAISSETLDQPILQSACLPNPTGFGSLRIKDNNPFSTPRVDLNLYGSRKTLSLMRTCVERMLQVHGNMPPPFKIEASSLSAMVNTTALRQATVFGLHFVGGCRVGAVVKGDLSVKGVRGLKVIDASILRSIPTSAGPMASTYMIAEYAAARLVRRYEKDENNGKR